MAFRIQGITVEIGGDTTKLSTALSKVNKEIRDTQSQYDALQREIVETEKALEELKKQADKSAVALQKIGATGEKLKNVGSSIEGVGKKLMPVTATVGGLGAAAVKVMADFDSGMSQVAAVSGATWKELDALREKAREMGAKTKFSASEAAEAMNYMAMAGWKKPGLPNNEWVAFIISPVKILSISRMIQKEWNYESLCHWGFPFVLFCG